MKQDVDDLVEKISSLNICVTKRKTGRLAEHSTRKDDTHQVRVHTRAPSTAPNGLQNPGNMCYANVVLQALSFSPAFAGWSQELALRNFERWMDDEDCVLGVNVLLDIGLIVERAYARSDKKASPAIVLQQLCSHEAVQEVDPDTGFGGEGQQDAHEFTQLVFFSLQRLEELCTPKTTTRSRKTTTLNETMSGTTHVTRTCTVCKAASTTEDAWNILTLHVSPTCESLSDCFDTVTEKQTLDGDDMVLCKHCKNKTKTIEQSRLVSASDILVVHLNLFIQRRNRTLKLRRTVDIPTTHHLNLYSPTRKRYKKDEYELTAAVMHQGASTKSGHYTCYVRSPDGQWFFCNDERVSRRQEDKLTFLHAKKTSTSNPYLLFFSKA